MESQRVHRFRDFEIDERSRQLRKAGRALSIEPRVFDVLAHLVRHRERVVTQDELIRAYWPGPALSRSALPRCISAARRLLDDRHEPHRWIGTIRGRGYRFVGEVESSAEPGAAGRDAVANPLVGRESHLADLCQQFEDVVAGRARSVLLGGEPGIGKTALAWAFASEARSRGARVIVTQCAESEGMPAYWPWMQVMREILVDLDRESLRIALENAGPALAELLPELRPRLPATAVDLSLPPDDARWRLHNGVVGFLEEHARRRALVLVFDDLHRADAASLRLFSSLCSGRRRASMMVVGTCVHGSERLPEALHELREQSDPRSLQWVRLPGLDGDAVARLVELVTGRPASAALVATLAEVTGGNPLFLRELIREIARRGELNDQGEFSALASRPPPKIQNAIDRTLGALSFRARKTLALAAVIGHRAPLWLIERASPYSRDEVAAGLDEGFASELVRLAQASPEIVFAHGLVRLALYESLEAPHRVLLHARVAAALVAEGPRGPAAVSEIAHHAFLGAPAGELRSVLRWVLRAAKSAADTLAFEEAATQYHRALELLDFLDARPGRRRIELLLSLAQAERNAGDVDRSREACLAASEIARELGRPDLLARAALVLSTHFFVGAGGDPALRSLLEEAREQLDDRHRALHARVLNQLLNQPPYFESMQLRRALSDEAIALVEGGDDSAALIDALASRWKALLGPDHIDEVLALGTRLIHHAQRSGEAVAGCVGHEFCFGAALTRGDGEAADRDLAELDGSARKIGAASYQWLASVFQTSRDIAKGEFEIASQAIHEHYRVGRRFGHPGTQGIFHGQAVTLAFEREDFDEAEQHIGALALSSAWARSPLLVALRARLEAFRDRPELARAAIACMFDEHLHSMKRDESWLVIVVALTDAVAAVGTREQAAELVAVLHPHASLQSVHDLLRVSLGPVSYYLGLLHHALGKRSDARARFEYAAERSTCLGEEPARIRSELGLARVLAESGDERSARRKARECAIAAERLGMERTARLARGLVVESQTARKQAAPPQPTVG